VTGRAVELHPDLAPLAALLGAWLGEGVGVYPTIDRFAYGEEVAFSHVGKPFLVYRQRTWALDDGRPLHSESGFWRMREGGRLELVLALSTGHVEIGAGQIEAGQIESGRIVAESTSMAGTPSAKQVVAVRRAFEVAGDRLRYSLDMAAVGQPMQRHLDATLVRGAD
jgi:hypothetical protein